MNEEAKRAYIERTKAKLSKELAQATKKIAKAFMKGATRGYLCAFGYTHDDCPRAVSFSSDLRGWRYDHRGRLGCPTCTKRRAAEGIKLFP